MNYRLVAKYLGQFTVGVALLMLLSAAWAVYFQEWRALSAFTGSISIAAIGGSVLLLLGRGAGQEMYERETLALVSLGWLLAAGVGALPFVLSGVLTPIDAYFESMSGFTTTGSSVLPDIEATAKSILFWRSFTHWVGGMGIIVLFVAVLPYLGVEGKHLFKSEMSRPDREGLRPRVRDTAALLYKLYFGFTFFGTVFLMLAGMNLYEALCHTFGALASGGYSTRQASIGAFHSLPIELIIMALMIIAGTNFGLFFAMLRGDWKAPLRNTEWRVYMGLLVVSTLLVTANLMGMQGRAHFDEAAAPAEAAYSFGHALRGAAFTATSLMTTTGYCTDDFDMWPYFSQMLFIFLMIIGGSAGSTSGGLKVVRFAILIKMLRYRIEATFRPKTVRSIRINDEAVDEETRYNVYTYLAMYVFVFSGAVLLLSGIGLPFRTAISAVAATLNGVGPGLEHVGAARDFHLVPDSGKLVLCLCMLLGRLELFTFCALFVPGFWKRR